MPKDDLCRACFDGIYPVKLPEPEHLGKHLLELSDITDVDGVRTSRRRWRRLRGARPALTTPTARPPTATRTRTHA